MDQAPNLRLCQWVVKDSKSLITPSRSFISSIFWFLTESCEMCWGIRSRRLYVQDPTPEPHIDVGMLWFLMCPYTCILPWHWMGCFLLKHYHNSYIFCFWALQLFLFWFLEGLVGDLSGSLCLTSFPTFFFLSAQCNSIRCRSPTIWFRSGQDGWISFASQSGSQFQSFVWAVQFEALRLSCVWTVQIGMASCWLHQPKLLLMKCRRRCLGRAKATRPVRFLEILKMDGYFSLNSYRLGWGSRKKWDGRISMNFMKEHETNKIRWRVT